MKKVLAGLCVAATMAAVSGAALAADSGFYGAVDIGQSKAKKFCDTEGVAGLTVTSCDDKDTAYRIGVGYQFNQNFGLEANYVDFGNLGVSGTYLGVPFTYDAEANAFQLAVTGTMPINESFAVIGKLGMARTSVDVTVAGAVTRTASDDSTGLTYGIGVRYNINKAMAVRAQYENFDKSTPEDEKLSLISVGLTFGF